MTSSMNGILLGGNAAEPPTWTVARAGFAYCVRVEHRRVLVVSNLDEQNVVNFLCTPNAADLLDCSVLHSALRFMYQPGALCPFDDPAMRLPCPRLSACILRLSLSTISHSSDTSSGPYSRGARASRSCVLFVGRTYTARLCPRI